MKGQDFYIYKLANINNGKVCMLICQFFYEETYRGKVVPHYYAKVWQLQSVPGNIGSGGYIVLKYDSFIIDTYYLTLFLSKMIVNFEIDYLLDLCVLLGQQINIVVLCILLLMQLQAL